MKLVFGIILLCLAGLAHAAPRVVGGKDAPEGKYPYQVSLRDRNFHFCGGSILNKRWILTAAHCVRYNTPEMVAVVAGTTLLEGGNEQIYQSEYFAEHRGFELLEKQSDIALIRVSKDIEFNDKVQPISLPDNEFYRDGQPVNLTGWGDIDTIETTPNNLQEITLKLYDQGKCHDEMIRIINVTESHICTLTKQGEGACFGDSGGPLVADGIQIGIVSLGVPCARGKPDVFTRVYTFLDWIATEQAKF